MVYQGYETVYYPDNSGMNDIMNSYGIYSIKSTELPLEAFSETSNSISTGTRPISAGKAGIGEISYTFASKFEERPTNVSGYSDKDYYIGDFPFFLSVSNPYVPQVVNVPETPPPFDISSVKPDIETDRGILTHSDLEGETIYFNYYLDDLRFTLRFSPYNGTHYIISDSQAMAQIIKAVQEWANSIEYEVIADSPIENQ